MSSVLAGGFELHIRWGPHLRGRPVVQQPPVYKYTEAGGGAHTGLY